MVRSAAVHVRSPLTVYPTPYSMASLDPWPLKNTSASFVFQVAFKGFELGLHGLSFFSPNEALGYSLALETEPTHFFLLSIGQEGFQNKKVCLCPFCPSIKG